MTLNFSLPHMNIYADKTVDRVIIPGAEGVYGVTAGHTPIVSQLKPGVVEIVHEAAGEAEKYFVSGGFALTHDTSVTDISAFEAVKLDDLDAEAVKTQYSAAASAFGSAAEGSAEKAAAGVQMDTAKAMGDALGVAL